VSLTVTPFLWFNGEAEDAARLYLGLLADSRIVAVSRWGAGGSFPEGTAMMVRFELLGRPYHALNGGPHYRLNEAFSLAVSCPDQAEVDRLWTALTAEGGEEGRCGWLKDRFGVSWQIIPEGMAALMADPDPARADRARAAMFAMKKIDLAAMAAAADGAA
jgi:predicted 3-demethylubiquinone-9 3-methyltransferase (glyoxalase superfamily)